MEYITSMEVAEVLGRKSHGNFLVSLRRLEAKSGRRFKNATRIVKAPNCGFARECPYFKLTLEDCKFISSSLVKPGEKERIDKFIIARTPIFKKSPRKPVRKSKSMQTKDAVSKQPHIELFRSDIQGELHITFADGKLWYCISDICRSLELLLKEGERIVMLYGNATKSFLVSKQKRIISEEFTDYDGFITLVIESRKAKANEYRKWVESTLPTKHPVLPPISPDSYPTLDEYFTLYVPAPEFHQALTEVNNHCMTAAGRSAMNPDKRKSLLRDVGILNTFCDTLQAVYQLAQCK